MKFIRTITSAAESLLFTMPANSLGGTLRDSGVMSFLLSRDSSLYKADLRIDSDKTSRALATFDSDTLWIRVMPDYT